MALPTEVPTPTPVPTPTRPDVNGYLLNVNGEYFPGGSACMDVTGGEICVYPMVLDDGSFKKRSVLTLAAFPEKDDYQIVWGGTDSGNKTLASLSLTGDAAITLLMAPYDVPPTATPEPLATISLTPEAVADAPTAVPTPTVTPLPALTATPGPTPTPVLTPTPVASFVQDGFGPKLAGFSFTPTTIDTASGDATVTVTLTATDSGSGVCISNCSHNGSATQVRFTHPGSGQMIDAHTFSLMSGTLNDGVFESQITVPQGSAGGTWNVSYILLVDDLGIYRHVNQAEIASLGYTTVLTNSGQGDEDPPSLAGFSFTPTTIDTTSGDATVTVTLTVTDSGSGVCISNCSHNGGATQVRFAHGGSGQFKDAHTFSLMSGTLNDGVFESQFTVPQGSAGGMWNVSYILLVDDLGINRYVEKAEIASLGYLTELSN